MQPNKNYAISQFIPEFSGSVLHVRQASVPDVPTSVLTAYNAAGITFRFWYPSGLSRATSKSGYYLMWNLFGFAGAAATLTQPFKMYTQLVFTPEQAAAVYLSRPPDDVPADVLAAYAAAGAAGAGFYSFGGVAESVSRSGSVVAWVWGDS